MHDVTPPPRITRETRSERGFTLIEIAVVLVIIGLIVGGVLVGQDLIKAAPVRAEMSELENVETAIYAFRDKYSALPGDISNATTFFGTTDANGYAVANGNGDGTIVSSISSYTAGDCMTGAGTQFGRGSVPNEVEEVFHHLNLAGMGNYNIASPAADAGSGLTSFPDAVLGGGMLVTCMDNPTATVVPAPLVAPAFQSGNAIVIGATPLVTGGVNYWYSTRIAYILGWASGAPNLTFTPDMASRLDAKMDDGLPYAGRVGVAMTCSGYTGIWPPSSTYQAMASSCGVSLVKMLGQ
jgi:prepilin-type N-terminal cleavage/methylation domain-containing protein